jgi:acylphosphatase
MICRRFTVKGLVQGVNFRASTMNTARRLELTGWVRNLPDGCVELVACGEEMKLHELEKWLHQGPPHANVQEVTALNEAAQLFDGFEIRA